jgi:hypothetical protein
MSIEREVVEQHTLFDLPWSHHRLSSCLSTGLNQWTFTVSTSAFFNKIGHEQTSCVAATMCSLQHRFPTMTCSQPHLYASATRTSRQIANRRFGKIILNVESDISFLVELLRPIVLEWG